MSFLSAIMAAKKRLRGCQYAYIVESGDRVEIIKRDYVSCRFRFQNAEQELMYDKLSPEPVVKKKQAKKNKTLFTTNRATTPLAAVVENKGRVTTITLPNGLFTRIRAH